MIECFRQQEQMSVLELYIENDVAGGSAFHYANSVRYVDIIYLIMRRNRQEM